MSYPIEFYTKKFAALRPKLIETLQISEELNSLVSHSWHNDGCSSYGWIEGETPKSEPTHKAFTNWNPEFTLRASNYSLHGRLDDDGKDPYWVLDLKISHKNPLHDRKGFRGPYATSEIYDILEEDLVKLPELIEQFSNITPPSAKHLSKKHGIEPLPKSKADLNQYIATLK
jgi:hypothetical protein